MSAILNRTHDDLTKREREMLGRIYAAEIDAALSKEPIRGVFQTKSTKLIQGLKDKGLVKEVELLLGGRFPVRIRGWELTLLGNATYCLTC